MQSLIKGTNADIRLQTAAPKEPFLFNSPTFKAQSTLRSFPNGNDKQGRGLERFSGQHHLFRHTVNIRCYCDFTGLR